jgi:hypothetical protein
MVTRSMRGTVCTAIFCVVLASGGVANAQPSPAGVQGVVVRPVACGESPWSTSTWLELLRVELASDGISVASAEGSMAPETSVVSVEPATCDAAAKSATLTFSSGDVRRTRTLNLADAGAVAQPRVLAIALADLIRSGVAARSPAALAPTVSVPMVPASPPEAVHVDVHVRFDATPRGRAAQPLTPASFSLFAAAETRLFAQGNTGLFGARGGTQLQLTHEAALQFDAGVLRGSAGDPLGHVSETVATLAATFLGTGGTGGVRFGVGPRFEAGIGWLQGHAAGSLTSASNASSALAFLGLSGTACCLIREPFSGFMSFDAGTTLYGFSARADQRFVSDLTGPLVSVRMGFFWTPSQR